MKKFLIICLVLLTGLCLFADSNTSWDLLDNGVGVFHKTTDGIIINGDDSVLLEELSGAYVLVSFYPDSDMVAYVLMGVPLKGTIESVAVSPNAFADEQELLKVKLDKQQTNKNGIGLVFSSNYKVFDYVAKRNNSYDLILVLSSGQICIIRCNTKTLGLYI